MNPDLYLSGASNHGGQSVPLRLPYGDELFWWDDSYPRARLGLRTRQGAIMRETPR
jgi:hypothetical protein